MDQLFIKVMEKTKEWNTLLFLLKYYDALEWETRFTLALNAAKNIDSIKKCFRQKLFIIEFPTKKKLSGRISLSNPPLNL